MICQSSLLNTSKLVMNNRNLSDFIILPCLILLASDAGITDVRVKRLSEPTIDNKTSILARYVVSLRTRTPFRYYGDNHFCGGVIISLTFIMTSAHCLIDSQRLMLSSRDILIVAGAPNRLKYFRHKNVHAPVAKILIHENFTIYNTNDLALLKLVEPLPTDNQYIAVMRLPTEEPKLGNKYTVLGWGRLFHGGPLASDITQITVTLYSHVACELMLNVFTDEMMCAGNMDHRDINPCGGDLGGPMIDDDIVYGIVSYRIGCGHIELPSVYTNIFGNLEWIDSIMSQNRSYRLYNCVVFLLLVININFYV
ncbi:mite allergen Eur m 3 [Drosophila pseudoobscura]|uniref:trypsin n=1 Tax=Drosophila pseudoobscura pseudoobscura TaxID=46245 RepID=Q29DK0_DROPS|nr:mite allergen Eur m 3 [Drosophila pseudoobscura]